MKSLRPWVDLSGYYLFQTDPEEIGEEDGWYNGFEGSQIYVPSAWNEQNPTWDLYFGKAWYFRRFYVAFPVDNYTAWVVFDGAGYLTKVWVNGKLAGEHEGSFSSFRFRVDVKQGWNTLAVEIDNTPTRTLPVWDEMPNALFFHYGGIQRPVRLEFAKEPYVTDVTFTSSQDGAFSIVTKVSGNADVSVELSRGNRIVYEGKSGNIEDRLPSPDLWSPENPALYDLTISTGCDTVLERVGFRSVEVKPDGIYLNGKRVFLKGFGRHEDFPVTGKYMPGSVLIRDFYLMKELNANSFRTSHYPYSNDHLDLADQMGFLVILEAPVAGMASYAHRNPDAYFSDPSFLEAAKAQLAEMINEHKNRPSVIAYSVANEPESVTPASKAFLDELKKVARTLDPTRPVTHVSYRLLEDVDYDTDDFISINSYNGWYSMPGDPHEGASRTRQVAEQLHRRYNKPVLVTEFGAEGIAGVHSDPPVMWSEEYQALFIEEYVKQLRSADGVCGLHVWNFADFRIPQNVKWALLNRKGVFTRDRQPKLAAQKLKQLYGEIPAYY
ncbi:glycoside hydrolase family 2 TIM barrel-domain containing protein [Tardisphaera miroshnichenkoae]